MIKINLLPLELRPVRRSLVPYLISGAVLLVAVLVMIVKGMFNQFAILQAQSQLEANQRQLQELSPVVEKSEKLDQDIKRLETKIRVIQEIVRDRLIWSKQLWHLSRLAPKNCWYSGFKVQTEQVPELVAVLDPKTNEPKKNPETGQVETQTKLVPRLYLVVSGYTVEYEGLTDDINPLLENVTAPGEFSELFELEPPAFKNDLFEEFPVKSYTLKFAIRPKDKAGRDKAGQKERENVSGLPAR